MAKIKHAIINFYLRSTGIHEFKTAYEYLNHLYDKGDGFRELAKKINAAQEIQITAQGLRKHLITHGLKPDPSRYKTKQFSPSLQDEAYIKADTKRFNALQAKTDEIIRRCEETTLKYEQEMQEKDKEISRLAFLLLNAIPDLMDVLKNKSWDELDTLIKGLDKEFNAFSKHSMS